MVENRIPRWFVENDPSWEKSIDSDFGKLRWTKKGTGIQATSEPTSFFCEIVGQPDHSTLSDLAASLKADRPKTLAAGAGDITKYLSSRYLNPGINGPRFDLRNARRP